MRIKWIDIAKGIGLYLVILGHLVKYGSPVFNWIFSFHMPLFFLVSGITFSYSGNYFFSIKKTLKNLVIPYFAIVIFGIIISLLVPTWAPLSLKRSLLEVFYYVQPESLHVGQIWFLFALAMVQIIFISIREIKIKNIKVEFVVIILISIGALFLKYFETKFHLPNLPFKLDTVFMAILFFYIGFIIKEKNLAERLNHVGNKYLRAFIIAIALLLNIYFGPILNSTINMAANNYNHAIFFFISSFSGIFAILLLSTLIKENKYIEFYGKNSLSIFSIHSVFLYLFSYCLGLVFAIHFSIMNNIPLLYCFIGSLFVCILSIPIPKIYGLSVGKLINLFTKKNS